MINKKVELPYFHVCKDKYFGGSQSWMLDYWMKIGGCGALTTCDALIYMAIHCGHPEFYPYQIQQTKGGDPVLKKGEYRKFGMYMKNWVQPRETGIKDIETYMSCVRYYMEHNEHNVKLTQVEGTESLETAKAAIAASIDKGMPIAYLMLKHKDKKFNFFEWHWFLVVGYDSSKGFKIRVATYGKEHWLDFEKLWDTGYDEKGGMVLFDLED